MSVQRRFEKNADTHQRGTNDHAWKSDVLFVFLHHEISPVRRLRRRDSHSGIEHLHLTVSAPNIFNVPLQKGRKWLL